MDAENITNGQLRELISEKGITTDNITQSQLNELHRHLSICLLQSGCFKNQFQMDGRKGHPYMTCSSHYFNKREAVSFNSDGFIGFAGWASTNNVIPIRQGVLNWLDELTNKPEGS